MDSGDSNQRNKTARKIMIDLSIMTVIGIVLAFVGPFGSFAEPLAYRLVSWVSFAWIGYAIYSPMSWVVDRLYVALELPRPGLWVAAVALATVPMAAVVWSMGFLPGPVRMPTLDQALSSYFYVFLVGGGITAFFYMLETRSTAAEVQPEPKLAEVEMMRDVSIPEPAPNDASVEKEAAEPASSPRLLGRLPAELGSEIIALEMEDHYVRVHTALGSELVLLRMRDAMAELDGIEGLQTHRSWWVARGAVEDVLRAGRNVRLRLARDIEAPVSRANISVLKDAGWI